MRVCVLPLVALTLVSTAVACTNQDEGPKLQPGRLRVGVLVEGQTENLIAAGAQVAADELNNAGGIDGVAPLELVIARPAGVGGYARAARLLLRRGATAILLPCSHIAEVAEAVRNGALMLAPCLATSAPLPQRVYGTGLSNDDPILTAKPIPGRKLDEFYERYKARYGTRPSSSVPALGYDALKVLAAAAEEAGSRMPESLERELREGLEVGGAFGRIRYEDGRRRPTVDVRSVA